VCASCGWLPTTEYHSRLDGCRRSEAAEGLGRQAGQKLQYSCLSAVWRASSTVDFYVESRDFVRPVSPLSERWISLASSRVLRAGSELTRSELVPRRPSDSGRSCSQQRVLQAAIGLLGRSAPGDISYRLGARVVTSSCERRNTGSSESSGYHVCARGLDVRWQCGTSTEPRSQSLTRVCWRRLAGDESAGACKFVGCV